MMSSVRKFLVCASLTTAIFVLFLFNLREERVRYVIRAPPIVPTRSPVILAWTGFFGEYPFMTPDLLQLGCPVWNCNVTSDRSLVDQADAVLFHVRDVNVNELPRDKPEGQRWVLINYESPFHVPGHVVTRLEKQVDWTVSYRSDSDIVSPYGLVRPRKGSDPPPMTFKPEDFAKKLPVVWMVSNCNSRSGREELARSLKEHVLLHVYGGCADKYGEPTNLIVPERRNVLEGFKYLAQRYKFYLSFENSLCEDYATEKVFTPLQVGLVPVVLGGADYKRILPPRSFVDSSAFGSPQNLAKHLEKLSKNYSLYSEYHEWRKDYVLQHVGIQNTFACDVCARLHENVDPSGKTERDLKSWWDVGKACRTV